MLLEAESNLFYVQNIHLLKDFLQLVWNTYFDKIAKLVGPIQQSGVKFRKIVMPAALLIGS